MSGFIGWRLEEPTSIDAAAFESAWPRGTTESSRGTGGDGLVVNRTREPLSTAEGDGTWCVVDGSPRWSDGALARVAAEQGDAAAALAAYRGRGSAFVEDLDGSFALALVDRAAGRTVLAVDRFGSRPLAYVSNSNGLVFGSSVELLRRHPAVSVSIDPQAVYDYLFFHFVPSPRTIYREATSLEPCEVVTSTAGGVESRRWWSPRFDFARTRTEVEDLRRELPERLEAAVRGCGPAAGFGAYLSGGLDSSTVAGFLAKALGGSAPAYCVGFDQQGYDEMEFARIAARHFNLGLREIYATPSDVARIFGKVTSECDEPFGNSSVVPAYLCASRAADDGVHVLLAGDGGDELFGGNERYVRHQVFERYFRLPAWSRKGLLEPILGRSAWADNVPLLRKAASYVKQASMPMPDRTQSYNPLHRLGADAILEPELLAAVDVRAPFDALRERYFAAPTTSALSRELFLDWKFTLADNDLRKVRSSSQMADVAVRYPMLDGELVALSARIPDGRKIVGGELRKFYKDSLASFLPQEIIRKKKHGFGLPFGEWLNASDELREVVFDSLASLRSRKIVRGLFLDELLQRHRNEHAAYYGVLIWVFAVLGGWLADHDA